MNNDAFLVLDRLEKRFGDLQVLQRIHLEVREGEILALLGPSGSGKTTALRLLAGFETPDGGAIRVAGEDVTNQTPARRGFGMVFQHYALFPHLSVGENVAFGLETRGWTVERIQRRVTEMLEVVDLPGFEPRRLSEVSGGQQQRVALARALAPEPRLLLLDEPLSNLDPSLRERTRRQLRQAIDRIGITTILVTHEQEEAFHLGDRVAVLHGGVLQQVGPAEELYEEPATRFVATFVGKASVLAGTVDDIRGDRRGVRIRCGAQTVVWEGWGSEAASGTSVELIVRPEALALAAVDQSQALTGTVVERRYGGPLTYFAVELEGSGEAPGPTLEVLAEARAAAVGDRVGVALRPQGPAPRIFAGGEAP